MFVAIGLTLAADLLFHRIGVFPPLGQRASDSAFLLATVYRIVFSVLGSYITARLAPNRPMRLALIGGAIGLLASIVGAVATWNHQPSLGPHWYPLALVVTALPCAWLGGKLRLGQISV
jgi:peptidoglycan/LPS O-acetylase OafA/YrhL